MKQMLGIIGAATGGSIAAGVMTGFAVPATLHIPAEESLRNLVYFIMAMTFLGTLLPNIIGLFIVRWYLNKKRAWALLRHNKTLLVLGLIYGLIICAITYAAALLFVKETLPS